MKTDFSVIEASRILNVSPQTVYGLLHKGEIKKLGKRISRESLEKYLLSKLEGIHARLDQTGWEGEFESEVMS